MRCPICKTTQLQPRALEEDLVTYACETCCGQYVKSHHYLKWVEQHGASQPERPAAEGVDLPVPDSKPGKLCPECGAFLIRHKVGHGLEFCIDRCGHCGGIWLDENEWEVLKSRGLHDDVHFMFTQTWQMQVKREERREHYAELVLSVLDGKLAQAMKRSDINRIKEIKAWLDQHPSSAELYAYLNSTRDL